MFTYTPIWTAAFTEFQLACLEVRLEVAPFLLGRFAVLGLGPQGPPVVEEGPVGADELLIEDGHVCLSSVDVLVAEQTGDDVNGQPVGHGIRGKQAPEIVC